ncbi:MAG: hypothetical protein ACXVCY_04185 [Pseudobdellovibrionaceae bacterium]
MSKYLVISSFNGRSTVHGRYDDIHKATEHKDGIKYIYPDVEVQVVLTGPSTSLKKAINIVKRKLHERRNKV